MKFLINYIFLLFSLLLLTSCDSTTQYEKDKEPSTAVSKENVESDENLSTSEGYIVKINKEESIWFSSAPEAKIEEGVFFGTVYDITDIDKSVVSKLEVGLKVKVTHGLEQTGSLPSLDTAKEIEIIKE